LYTLFLEIKHTSLFQLNVGLPFKTHSVSLLFSGYVYQFILTNYLHTMLILMPQISIMTVS